MVALGSNVINIIVRADDRFSGVFKSIQRNVAIAGAAITGFGIIGANAIKAVVTASGEFEQTKTAFSTFLGSEEAALSKLKELTDFATKTPFTITGIERSSRQLLAVGVESENLIPTLKSLGDVSSGLGLGEEGLQRLILNLGQVKTQGKLTGRELRDFAVAGVPLISELAKNFGVTEAEIKDMVSAGEIGFDDVTAAFDSMSGEGGRFFNLMDKQSKTFLGQVSNIEDSLIKVARTMGDALLPAAKFVAEKIQLLVQFFEEHPKIAKFAAVAIAVASALALIIGPLLILIAFIPAVIAGFGALTAISLPLIAVILGIMLAIGLIIAIILNWGTIVEFFKGVWKRFVDNLKLTIQDLKAVWSSIWKFIANVFINVWNSIIEGFETGVNVFIKGINLLIRAMNKVSKVVGFTLPEVPLANFSGAKIKQVNDFIITRNGELIETHPNDTIFGMKNPGGAMGGGNISITVEGNLIGLDEDDIAIRLNDLIRNKISI